MRVKPREENTFPKELNFQERVLTIEYPRTIGLEAGTHKVDSIYQTRDDSNSEESTRNG